MYGSAFFLGILQHLPMAWKPAAIQLLGCSSQSACKLLCWCCCCCLLLLLVLYLYRPLLFRQNCQVCQNLGGNAALLACDRLVLGTIMGTMPSSDSASWPACHFGSSLPQPACSSLPLGAVCLQLSPT
jgi:hypothetical protein